MGPGALIEYRLRPHGVPIRRPLVRDTVRYSLPLGPFGRLAHSAFVWRDLERIFDFRQAEVARRLGA